MSAKIDLVRLYPLSNLIYVIPSRHQGTQGYPCLRSCESSQTECVHLSMASKHYRDRVRARKDASESEPTSDGASDTDDRPLENQDEASSDSGPDSTQEQVHTTFKLPTLTKS